jgi:6-phosphogluconolactonase
MDRISRRSLLATMSLTPIISSSSLLSGQTSAAGYLLFAGTYTKGTSKGIYAYRFQGKTGDLMPLGLVAETEDPTFLALSANHSFLYAANEIGNYKGTHSGLISSFGIDHLSGKLKPVNAVASAGSGPCQISVDHSGQALFVANYGSGSSASFQLGGNGHLSAAVSQFQYSGHGPNKERQESAHTHCTAVSPDNRWVLVNDLGLDRIMVYRLDPSTAKLTPNDPPYWSAKPGVGPRHLAFHPKAGWAYSVNEMASSIDALAWNTETGTLKPLQTVSTLPADFHGENTAAEIAVDATGHFVYASNRGHDSVAVFAINQNTGQLKPVNFTPAGGQQPRFFTLDPTGLWLLTANQQTGNIVVFKRDPASGRLIPAGKTQQLDSVVTLVFA